MEAGALQKRLDERAKDHLERDVKTAIDNFDQALREMGAYSVHIELSYFDADNKRVTCKVATDEILRCMRRQLIQKQLELYCEREVTDFIGKVEKIQEQLDDVLTGMAPQ